MAMMSCGIKQGDKVVVSPFCCDSVINVILEMKCEPVFCDIDEDTFNMSPESLKDVDIGDAKALIAVHNFGFPCDLDGIKKITGDMIIIEDAAQAIGSKYKKKVVGSFGDVSVLSFYATKLLTTGEGGAVVTNDENVYSRLKYLKSPGYPISYLLKNPGKANDHFEDLVPLNHKISDMQAAMGIVQLSKLKGFCERRREIARMYNKGLRDTGLKLPVEKEFGEHVYSRYTITCRNDKEREKYVKHLMDNGIEVGILWPESAHLSERFSRSGYKEGDFPVVEKIAKRVFSIPIHPNLTNEEVDFVIEKIKEIAWSQ
jgi:dTDP-4-amino-4,6-dideoxygalactose transaminase